MKKIIIGILFVYILLFVIALLSFRNSGKDSSITEESVQPGVEALSPMDSGLVCAGNKTFSFDVNYPYTILSDESDGISILTDYGLVSVSLGGGKTVDKLKEFGVVYEKEGDKYFYQVPKSAKLGMTQDKDAWSVSVFYTKDYEENAKLIFSGILESLKNGCK